MRKITRRQNEIFEYLVKSIEVDYTTPTFREIAEHFEISIKAAYDHVKALEKKGKVQCDRHRARGLVIPSLVGQGGINYIPIIDSLNNSRDLFARENYTEVRKLFLPMFRKGSRYFAVRGGSIVQSADLQVLPNDLLVIEHHAECKDGDMVIAHIQDNIQLRYHYKDATRILLKSTGNQPPVYTQLESVLGRVLALFRDYVPIDAQE